MITLHYRHYRIGSPSGSRTKADPNRRKTPLHLPDLHMQPWKREMPPTAEARPGRGSQNPLPEAPASGSSVGGKDAGPPAVNHRLAAANPRAAYRVVPVMVVRMDEVQMGDEVRVVTLRRESRPRPARHRDPGRPRRPCGGAGGSARAGSRSAHGSGKVALGERVPRAGEMNMVQSPTPNEN